MTFTSVPSTGISVGSTGTTGSSRGARSASDTPPAGFDVLLEGARPAHERPDETETSKTPRKASCESEDGDDAVAADTPKSDAPEAPAKPDAANDPFGLAGAQGAPVPTATPTPPPTPTPVVAGGDPAAADATAAPVVTATEVDPNTIIAAASDAETTAFTDVVNALLTESAADAPGDATANPPATPKLIALPDLPTAAPRTNTDNPSSSSAPKPAQPTPAALSAAAPDHPRPEAGAAPAGTAALAVAGSPTTGAAATVSAEVATTTSATVTPPPPASEQLVSVLKPMRATESGTYTLRLELKPPELGRVEMRVEMRDGVLHASIHAEHGASAQMLRDALGELRDRLGSEGVRTGDLTVSDGGVGSRQQASGEAPESRTAPEPTLTREDVNLVGATDPRPALDSETTSLLDVRV